jgi:transcriptional regulator of heat shock response
MPDVSISPRERMVLTAIIELYIATGEPVASQALARFFANKEGLSSATLRNVMATLGEAGLLEQPHTSAGRVPTAAAFRCYVEQITQPGAQLGAAQPANLGTMQPSSAALNSAALSPERRGQIEESFAGVASSNEYLERTSHVLALLSSGLGVALSSSTAGQVLEHIHFSRLSTGRVLAVLVTQAGAVQDRVLALDREMTHIELETAARYLNENFRGWLVERIRAEVARRVEVEREAYHRMLASVEAGGIADRLCGRTAAGSAGGGGAGRGIPGDAGPGADWRTGAAGRRQPGLRSCHRVHAHPISRDDSSSAVHCRALRAHSRRSRRLAREVVCDLNKHPRPAGKQRWPRQIS